MVDAARMVANDRMSRSGFGAPPTKRLRVALLVRRFAGSMINLRSVRSLGAAPEQGSGDVLASIRNAKQQTPQAERAAGAWLAAPERRRSAFDGLARQHFR